MKPVIVLAEAARDLEFGRDFYDAQHLGIGDYFVDSLLSDLESLRLFHGIHPRHSGFRFPWTNQEEALDLGFDENGIYHKSNGVILGDLGAIASCCTRTGAWTGCLSVGDPILIL